MCLALARQPPDLLVLDEDLPILSGFDVCRVVRSRPGLARIESFAYCDTQYADMTDSRGTPIEQRRIATRERQIAEGRRRMATSWFNVAVAYYNLSRKDEARR